MQSARRIVRKYRHTVPCKSGGSLNGALNFGRGRHEKREARQQQHVLPAVKLVTMGRVRDDNCQDEWNENQPVTCRKAKAKFTVVQDFPTPPFAEETRITCFTPGIGILAGSPFDMAAFAAEQKERERMGMTGAAAVMRII